ncbi:hypothetical protein P4388_25555 [Bacillus thuringiensis]|uniref:hypothetical protein n=1 Tax=unclassified Bacillus cereus group TaxID=2750818 RepID=UPI00017E2315|nr:MULTISPECIES: hypothetical protein [Bacillus cereus group]EDX59395.1 hypothetical protein BC03BB108_F0014 [Bacillus cereus 03BB108]MBN6708313.1 hypothetical protein [Bacillus thuringiensis]MCR6784496.1 hypothetical protein [Bacillus thuringiensis]MCR6862856.1 hypothetical protein [Bacillus thuringiensis]MCR6869402.1 hypothetical protein [Bacillus thuringiensis]
MEGVIYIINYYSYHQMFLIFMTVIAMFLYILYVNRPTSKNKWNLLIVVFLFFFINYLFIVFL